MGKGKRGSDKYIQAVAKDKGAAKHKRGPALLAFGRINWSAAGHPYYYSYRTRPALRKHALIIGGGKRDHCATARKTTTTNKGVAAKTNVKQQTCF